MQDNLFPIAYYIGLQETLNPRAPIALFNLISPIPGHCVGSTVSAQTLRANGVKVPSQLVIGQTVLGRVSLPFEASNASLPFYMANVQAIKSASPVQASKTLPLVWPIKSPSPVRQMKIDLDAHGLGSHLGLTMNNDISSALDGTSRITVLDASGQAIQTVLFSDYLREHDMSEASVALVLDGEQVFITHANPVFNHSVRLA